MKKPVKHVKLGFKLGFKMVPRDQVITRKHSKGYTDQVLESIVEQLKDAPDQMAVEITSATRSLYQGLRTAFRTRKELKGVYNAAFNGSYEKGIIWAWKGL